MPIYEYRCSSCGADVEVLQKLSDPRLVTCPKCHQDTLVKQVSAAGFQLKGSGWYVTDFRNGSKPAAKTDAKGDAKPAEGGDAKNDAAKPETKTETKSDSASTSEASTSTPAPSTPKPAASE